jgi:hypothetical protein
MTYDAQTLVRNASEDRPRIVRVATVRPSEMPREIGRSDARTESVERTDPDRLWTGID